MDGTAQKTQEYITYGQVLLVVQTQLYLSCGQLHEYIHTRARTHGDGNEDEGGDGQEDRDGGRSGNEDEDGEGEGVGGREPGNRRSNSRGGIGRAEGAREGATPTIKFSISINTNQQPQPQDPTPKRDRRIMRRTRAQGREVKGRAGEGGGEAKKRKKPPKSYRRDVENRGDY